MNENFAIASSYWETRKGFTQSRMSAKVSLVFLGELRAFA